MEIDNKINYQSSQQLHQLQQQQQRGYTISGSDFSIDEILTILEEEEKRSLKRTYDDVISPQYQYSIQSNQLNQNNIQNNQQVIGFMTANEYLQQQTQQDNIKYSDIQSKRSIENQSK